MDTSNIALTGHIKRCLSDYFGIEEDRLIDIIIKQYTTPTNNYILAITHYIDRNPILQGNNIVVDGSSWSIYEWDNMVNRQ